MDCNTVVKKAKKLKEKSKKKFKKTKSDHHKKRRSSSSSDSSSSSSSSDNERKRHRKEARRLKRESKKLHKLKRAEAASSSKTTTTTATTVEETEEVDCGIPIELMNSKAKAPQTREEYEAKQSIIRRVVGPDGRTRLIKGDGEIIEEIVSKDRHKDINKQATIGDGADFQKRTIGWNVSGNL